MNRLELIESVAELTGMPKPAAAQVVDSVFAAIQDALKAGDDVRLPGFGSFAVATRKAAKGRNPRTGEVIDVPESTSVRFKPGKGLKDAVR